MSGIIGMMAWHSTVSCETMAGSLAKQDSTARSPGSGSPAMLPGGAPNPAGCACAPLLATPARTVKPKRSEPLPFILIIFQHSPHPDSLYRVAHITEHSDTQ